MPHLFLYVKGEWGRKNGANLSAGGLRREMVGEGGKKKSSFEMREEKEGIRENKRHWWGTMGKKSEGKFHEKEKKR